MLLDTTLNELKTSCFHNNYHKVIQQMVKQTPFCEKELTCILLVYYKYTLVGKGNCSKFMTQFQFASFVDIAFEIRNERIINRILQIGVKDSRRYIKPEQWCKLFAVFIKGTFEEKMNFCFGIYDEEGDGLITHDVMKKFLEATYSLDEDDDPEGFVDEIIDLIVRKMDKDRDGFISYNDYITSVRATPHLMEFLGQCLPDKDAIIKAAHCCNIMSVIDKYNI